MNECGGSVYQARLDNACATPRELGQNSPQMPYLMLHSVTIASRLNVVNIPRDCKFLNINKTRKNNHVL